MASLRSLTGFFLLLIQSLLVLAAVSPIGFSKTLILVDNERTPEVELTYSKFISLLSSNGFELDIQNIDPSSYLELLTNGKRNYENIVIFPTKAKSLSSYIDDEDLIKFSETGGNFLLVSDEQGTQTDVSLFLNKIGIYPSPKGFKFLDYHDTTQEESIITSIENPQFLNPYIIPSNYHLSSIPYANGSVALLSNNEFLIPVLRTSKSSFTYDLDKGLINAESTWHTGSQGFLTVGFQGLNNARTLWLGSTSLLKDSTIDINVAESLIKWAFQINGVIKVTKFTHEKVDKEGRYIPPVDKDDIYKIKDYTKFEIGISQWNGESWVPFTSDTPIQLEFVMLDPYYRLNLELISSDNESSIYGTTFQIPDQHGMFTFKVDFKRLGLSYIEESAVVPVRHLANDEYPRSWEIRNSWVYLSGYAVVVFGWLIFVVLFIFSGKKAIAPIEKKTN